MKSFNTLNMKVKLKICLPHIHKILSICNIRRSGWFTWI